MFDFLKSRIARRTALLVFAAVMVAVTTSSSILVLVQAHDALSARRQSIETVGLVYATAVSEAVLSEDKIGALAVLKSIARVPNIRYAAVANAQGTQIAAIGDSVTSGRATETSWLALIDLLLTDNYSVTVSVQKAQKLIGYLVVTSDVSDLRGQVLNALLRTFYAMLSGGLISLWVGVQLQRRITRPLLSLILAITRMRAIGEFKLLVDHTADDETGTLVEAFNGMVRDIATKDSELEKLAYFDPLTGVGNRQMFRRKLAETLERCRQQNSCAAVLLLDLDEFKRVNDTLGHSYGDLLLVEVSKGLVTNSGRGLVVTRLGGDEFALIAEGINSEADAIEVVGRVCAAFTQPIALGHHMISVTTSVGCGLIPRDGDSIELVLRNIDLALYSAKRAGPGRAHVFRHSMLDELQKSTELGTELSHAIERNQLTAYFQPQVDLLTGEVQAFEALLRWTHPQLGSIPPSVFISIAESNGMIRSLGSWVLRDSCEQAAGWIAAGHPPREIAVNVSAIQLDNEFVIEVKSVLEQTGFPAHLLCLELTETIYAGNRSKVLRDIMLQLKALGLKLALDDFGTGYSSLSYLGKFPFDKIKLDRSFVSGADKDADRFRLLLGVAKLADTLGFSVVAEGAETDSEVRLLREIGVGYVQGFSVGRPEVGHVALETAARIPFVFKQRFGTEKLYAGR